MVMADHSLTDARPLPANALPILRSVIGGAVTVRAAQQDRSIGRTHMSLLALRSLGLVTWDEGKQGTLRPLVREVPFGADR